MISPVRLVVSLAAASTPTGVFSQRFEASFPGAGALGCTSCSLAHRAPQSTTSLGPPAATLPWVLSPRRLPVSAPPTCLDECFFFIFLVVGLPCSSIFCQFWLVFVFKLLLSFFWLCEEAQCVYLCLHLGQKPTLNIFLKAEMDEAFKISNICFPKSDQLWLYGQFWKMCNINIVCSWVVP